MSTFQLPKKVTVIDAIKLIAGSRPGANAGESAGLSKEQMVALARTACLTEGIAYQSLQKDKVRVPEPKLKLV